MNRFVLSRDYAYISAANDNEECPMTQDHEARIEQLEIDLAHANRTIEDLNSVAVTHGKQIDRLTQLLAKMTDQMEELAEQVLPAHRIDKPPHY
ncbi:SlyX protein [Labrenzia sp. EL_13]|nr:SlyX protein [Labrenzia sp. EL_13]